MDNYIKQIVYQRFWSFFLHRNMLKTSNISKVIMCHIFIISNLKIIRRRATLLERSWNYSSFDKHEKAIHFKFKYLLILS